MTSTFLTTQYAGMPIDQGSAHVLHHQKLTAWAPLKLGLTSNIRCTARKKRELMMLARGPPIMGNDGDVDDRWQDGVMEISASPIKTRQALRSQLGDIRTLG